MALLRTRPDRLTPQQRLKRDAFLEDNPAIKAIYQFQKQVHVLFLHKAMNKDWCKKKMIPQFLNMLDDLKNSPFKALAALGKTFCQW
ncbi:transposase, partial [Legionella pneumophila serogroup 1]